MIIALFAATVLMADSTTAMQVASTSASAPIATTAAAPNGKRAQADGKTLVCRKEVALGTRLPAKKCRTVEQMAVQRQEDKAETDAAQRNIVLEQAH